MTQEEGYTKSRDKVVRTALVALAEAGGWREIRVTAFLKDGEDEAGMHPCYEIR